VWEILEVKIDGVVLDPSEYRLDEYRWITRLADASGNPQMWPSCQRLDLEDTEPGTWSVTYNSGQPAPTAGVLAAAELACQIYLACNAATVGQCMLPSGVTKITRQGVTIERAPFVSWAFKDGAWGTGLSLVDAFLGSFNPGGLVRRPSVWTPDLPPYASTLGQ
jgi:hypothetical protein